eukprot:CAMPEP_0179412848 /NCGR_PEP_ID=MMETSP0799-20121207/4714_1 /TAXON_ID=46947 /ORGANISM="Geminigera cryophila, Strain CCMP2564" /LENGTH=112 /DNA_ID=CAMNT_0021185141 /DNA_START=164 /DNA_END=502 /DNA_ORIENTATION=-
MSVSGFGRAGAVAAARSPLTLAVLRKEVDMAKKLADIEDMGAPGIVRLLHNTAVQRGYMAYADPATGYNVWTTLKLRQRPCCGNGCRHCPYDHVNVPASKQCAPPIVEDDVQ